MVRVTVGPREQRDKWSLYWKTSMATKTDTLGDVELDVDPASTTGEAFLSAL